jgi:hypothetical protein
VEESNKKVTYLFFANVLHFSIYGYNTIMDFPKRKIHPNEMIISFPDEE